MDSGELRGHLASSNITSELYPNQPPGFEQIAIRDFSAREEEGWDTRQDRAFGIQEDPTAPVSGPGVGVANFPAGYRGGRGPIDTFTRLGRVQYRDLYVSCWVKLSDNFVGAPSNGINKLFHIWLDGKSVVVVSLQGRNRGPISPQFRFQNIQLRQRRGISFNVPQRLAGGPAFQRGQWHQLEILLRVNREGAENGQATLWVDGRMAANDSRIGFLRFGNPGGWERVSWNPTWGSPRDVVPQPMGIYMDRIYVSGSR